MIRYVTIALALGALIAWPAAHTVAGDAATPQEVIAKVKEAAAYLQKNGKAGLKAFDSADSTFVFKDTYVFVYDCARVPRRVSLTFQGTYNIYRSHG